MPHAECSTILHREGRLSALDATGTLGRAGLEAVGELAADGLEVLHAAGTSGLSPLGLLTPVVCGSMLVVFLWSSDALSVSDQVSVDWRRVVCDVHFLTVALG
jgi:hypothetical protein